MPYTVLAGGIWNGEKRALHCFGGRYMEWSKAARRMFWWEVYGMEKSRPYTVLAGYMEWRKAGLTLFWREVYGMEKRRAPDRRTQV